MFSVFLVIRNQTEDVFEKFGTTVELTAAATGVL